MGETQDDEDKQQFTVKLIKTQNQAQTLPFQLPKVHLSPLVSKFEYFN